MSGSTLAERQGHRQAAFEIPTEKAIRRHADIEGRFCGLVDDRRAVFLGEGETPSIRRTPAAPACWWMYLHTALICGPAVVARAGSATVLAGVRAGRSSSWRRCQPRGARRCSRRSCPVLGAAKRTC